MLKIVVIKLAAPKIEDAPARCRAKIAKSTAGPGEPTVELNGGYIVQPPPTPPRNGDANSNRKDGTRSQKLILFMRGNAISGAPIIKGTIQFPKPPIIAGITIKKIMIRPCAVTRTLYIW